MRMQFVRALIRHGFLTYSGDHGGPQVARPTITRITESGREALARVLADYADALARSEQEPRAEARAAGAPSPPLG
jgi:DNA-binding PadR family transcriptional regulator